MLLTQVSTNGHARTPNQDANSAAIIQQMTDALRSAVVIDELKLKLLLAALIAKGHILLEDVPGIGKTLIAKALARTIHATFKREIGRAHV